MTQDKTYMDYLSRHAQKYKDWFFLVWRPVLLSAIFIAGVICLLWFHMMTLLPGVSSREVDTIIVVHHLGRILHTMLYAPYYLVAYVSLAAFHMNNFFVLRSISAILGVLSIFMFYHILRHLYGQRVAVLGSVLFGMSSWFLHVSRFGAPYSMDLFGTVALIWVNLRIRLRSDSRWSLAAFIAIGTFVLYIPGFIWFVGGSVLWQWKTLIRMFREFKRYLAYSLVAMSVVLLVPFIYGIYLNPGVVLEVIGLPSVGPSIQSIASNLWHIPLWLVWRDPASNTLWLPDVPILSVFTSGLFILGIYSLLKTLHGHKARFILTAAVGSYALVCINGPTMLSMSAPVVFLVAASGMAFLLKEWFAVFPRNPIAHSIGAGLISIAVLTTSYYNLNQYFVAWPNTPKTVASFQVNND